MLGGLTDQIGRFFEELMQELRGIREELALLRSAIENGQQPHATLRPVKKTTAPKARRG
jgi:hypothetical protein